jgi:hypothetical protein
MQSIMLSLFILFAPLLPAADAATPVKSMSEQGNRPAHGKFKDNICPFEAGAIRGRFPAPMMDWLATMHIRLCTLRFGPRQERIDGKSHTNGLANFW